MRRCHMWHTECSVAAMMYAKDGVYQAWPLSLSLPEETADVDHVTFVPQARVKMLRRRVGDSVTCMGLGGGIHDTAQGAG